MATRVLVRVMPGIPGIFGVYAPIVLLDVSVSYYDLFTLQRYYSLYCSTNTIIAPFPHTTDVLWLIIVLQYHILLEYLYSTSTGRSRKVLYLYHGVPLLTGPRRYVISGSKS
jgi:hypothetical protein